MHPEQKRIGRWVYKNHRAEIILQVAKEMGVNVCKGTLPDAHPAGRGYTSMLYYPPDGYVSLMSFWAECRRRWQVAEGGAR